MVERGRRQCWEVLCRKQVNWVGTSKRMPVHFFKTTTTSTFYLSFSDAGLLKGLMRRCISLEGKGHGTPMVGGWWWAFPRAVQYRKGRVLRRGSEWKGTGSALAFRAYLGGIITSNAPRGTKGLLGWYLQ